MQNSESNGYEHIVQHDNGSYTVFAENELWGQRYRLEQAFELTDDLIERSKILEAPIKIVRPVHGLEKFSICDLEVVKTKQPTRTYPIKVGWNMAEPYLEFRHKNKKYRVLEELITDPDYVFIEDIKGDLPKVIDDKLDKDLYMVEDRFVYANGMRAEEKVINEEVHVLIEYWDDRYFVPKSELVGNIELGYDIMSEFLIPYGLE